jgi:2-methylisocitrate lyase-like PEP mutase family enzyme
MVPTGLSPEIPADILKAWGFDISIYPVLGLSVAAANMDASYRFLQARRSSIGLDVQTCTMDQLHQLMGFPEIWEFERRHAKKI